LFPVEIRLVERTEQTSTARISSIQKWLDNQGFEPSTFRYTFFQDGLVLRVDFALQPEAVAFADEFEWLGAHSDRKHAVIRATQSRCGRVLANRSGPPKVR